MTGPNLAVARRSYPHQARGSAAGAPVRLNKPIAPIIAAMLLAGGHAMSGIVRELGARPAPPVAARTSMLPSVPVSTGSGAKASWCIGMPRTIFRSDSVCAGRSLGGNGRAIALFHHVVKHV